MEYSTLNTHAMKENHERIQEIAKRLITAKEDLFDCGGWVDFTDWLNDPKNKSHNSKGIRKATIESLVSTFSSAVKQIEKQVKFTDAVEKDLKKIDAHDEKSKSFEAAVREFVSETKKVDIFHNKVWYVYFFYSELARERNKEPFIGRAVLKCPTPFHLVLENIPGNIHKNYIGSYKTVLNQACFLDLDTEFKDRKLHIKVYYSLPKKDTILLGSYITFEENTIVRGSVLMELADPDQDDVKPLKLSRKVNAQVFNDLSPAIQKYLQFKKYNFHKTPRGIFNHDELKSFTEEHEETLKSRFIESQKQKLFIASPGLSIDDVNFKRNKASIDTIVSRLNDKFSQGLDIEIHNNREKNIDLDEPRTLLKLKSVRFFVLIYTPTGLGSYSLVQLGWALAHCKEIILFYEQDSISEHIKTVPSTVHIQSFRDLEQDLDSIYDTIELKIMRKA